MSVNVPGQKPSLLKTIVPMALSAVGTAYGGAAGGMAGSKIGEGLVAGGGGGASAVQTKAPSSPMQRRVDQTAEDPQVQIARAQQALQQLPPEDQQKYGPALTEAQKRAQAGAMS